MGDIIVYDIETQQSFQEIGVRDPRKLNISLLGMYSFTENQYYSFEEPELPQFFRRLEKASLIVGFNNKGFDDPVVSAYFPEITKIPSFDILEEIYNRLGFRIKLDNIAQATLGYGKTADGLEAIRLFKAGKMQELRDYCLSDVKVTKEVYEFGKRNGFLHYTDLQGKKEVLVDFNKKVESLTAPLNLSLF